MDCTASRSHLLTRPRLIWISRLVIIASVACIGLFAIWQFQVPEKLQLHALWTTQPLKSDSTRPFNSSLYLNGAPTSISRENLRPEMKYITSWGSGGWTNDVISMINLLYLALITERIPIIPVFLPGHQLLNSYGYAGENPLVFSDVFDLAYLRDAMKIPILEWHQVKGQDDFSQKESIGCWSVWPVIQKQDPAPRKSFIPWFLKLDVSYTKAPDWIKLKPGNENDRVSTFWALAALAFPATRQASLVPPWPSKKNVTLPPDQHLLCFDCLYYLSVRESDELELDYSPAWRFVGQHMRWTPYIERMATKYLRKAFKIAEHDEIPPFIAVHVRHNDFIDWCDEGFKSPDDCFAPLSTIQKRVKQVQDELLTAKGIDTMHVVVTSDEKNNTWWEGIRELGWVRLDHEETKERYGFWHPILIDAVVQSMGAGFVGTARSTVSILASRRVETWRNGPTRMVRWGRPGADDD
ncbi:hypothetical protein MIND_00512100 [Mycena indigotica]|uniref:O-fucosyltransferase family protein n=1 Tax=Mycena indigotica TaxID=2126181 RepID=A0A8H6SXY3_9AGAR|nr:uncharacterized protein MIND_00512100 [Mycena indigotica]KAF7307185.1 hypothetical protein MIND_00512100 [Mycena indigotica]